jgi:hypothetical protein
MSGIGSNPTAEEIAAKEAQERELKEAQVSDLIDKAPSRTPSNVDSSGDSSSDSDSDSYSDSSDEDVNNDDNAAKCDRTAQNNSVLSPKPVHVAIKQ